MRKETLVFEIDKKNILSSNTYKSLHWAVKGKITDHLRTLAVEAGKASHPVESLPGVEERLELLREVAQQMIRKARRTKALQKDPELTAKEIKTLVEEEFSQEEIGDPSRVKVPNLFTHFTIKVRVSPPTRRRLDPVNLYPTVKAIIDGLTDAAWWEDDDFTHLLEISFLYGGTSGVKDNFKLEFTVEEVDEAALSTYITSTAPSA